MIFWLTLYFLLALDYFIYRAFRDSLSGCAPMWRVLSKVLYFLPEAVLAALMIGRCFKKVYLWAPFWRTYGVGIAVALLLVHFCYGLVWLAVKCVCPHRRGWFSRLVPHASALCLLSVFLYAAFFTTFQWRTDCVDMRKACSERPLPEGLRGYRIMQFSDFHIGSFTSPRRVEAVVSHIMGTQPDMIVFTGDMVNFATPELEAYMAELSRLRAPDGIYCVLGNHDYGNYVKWPDSAAKQANVDSLRARYRELGWTVLDNASVRILSGNDVLHLAGVENWGSTKRFPRRGDIEAALADSSVLFERRGARADSGMPACDSGSGAVYTVLLSHDPSYFDCVISRRYPAVDLTLSGHTHAMQVGVRINGRDYSPARLLYPHYAGLYKMSDGQCLYVNTGCGFNGLPFRLGIRPRFTLFVL